MNLRGEVSIIQNGKAKVYIKEKGLVTQLIDIAPHVGAVQINDHVVVAFYGQSLTDGVIIAKV